VKTLTIRWQRLVDERGNTCDRCGATGQAVRRAAADLRQALQHLAIDVRLETDTLSHATFTQAPLESNRLWIGGVPLEDWLGATSGQSPCCSACGDAHCRTLDVAGVSYEALPVELILKAGLLAAARLLEAAPAACCPSINDSAGAGCCG
jgi:hypothetical protein